MSPSYLSGAGKSGRFKPITSATNDVQALKNFFLDQASDIHCLTKQQATIAASLLHNARQKKAIDQLVSFHNLILEIR
jgi:hypothetical protein